MLTNDVGPYFIVTQKMFYRVIFLTVPLNFQYQHEKRQAANQRFRSMKFSKDPRWLKTFFFLALKFGWNS